MKLKNFMKERLGRQTVGIAAATVMALSAGTASATLLTDVTVGTTSIFDDSVQSFLNPGSPVDWEAFDANVDDIFRMLDLGPDDLLITSGAGLEGRSMDYAIDTNILSILYGVTGGSMTSASYVVAEFSYASALTGLAGTNSESASVAVYEATLTNPPAVPEAGSIALLLSGFGLLGVVRARRQRG